MFGTLHLLLAAMVVSSHVGVNHGGLWIGVTAVVIFFLLSGYAMTGLLKKRFPDPRDAPVFYLERFVRLAPQYYFWLALCLFFSLYLKWQPLKMAGFMPYGLFAYVSVVPLGLQRYFGSVDTLVMPQATTLGIEITLYAFSPWILKSRLLSWMAGLLCLAIFGATAVEVLPANIYTYYTSPAPMVYFILGSFLYKKDWISVGALASALVAVLCYGLPQRFNVEFLVGVIVGLPLLAMLSSRQANKLDTAFGDAPYGCFLGHGIFIWAARHYTGSTELTTDFRLAVVILSCLAGYAAFYVVERPTLQFRRKLKGGFRAQGEGRREQMPRPPGPAAPRPYGLQ